MAVEHHVAAVALRAIKHDEEGKEGGDGASALPVEVESQRVPKPRRRLVEDEQTDVKHQEEPKGAGRQHLFHDGAIPREDRCKETVVVGVEKLSLRSGGSDMIDVRARNNVLAVAPTRALAET